MGGNIMDEREWIMAVRQTIHAEWRPLFEYCEHEFLTILQNLHCAYQPKVNGVWKASPKWIEMFNWTSCSPHSMKAVLMLKEPLQNHPRLSYRSNGYAFGVVGPSPQGRIHKVSTIWNFFHLLFAMNDYWNPEVEHWLIHHFQHGFNPDYLSSNHGVLLLNLAPTKSDDGGPYFDLQLWDNFLLRILRFAVADHKSKVPLFLFYNNSKIHHFLVTDAGQKFNSFVPSFMNFGDSRVVHISTFDDELISRYITEINYSNEHVRILNEIFKIILKEYERLTY